MYKKCFINFNEDESFNSEELISVEEFFCEIFKYSSVLIRNTKNEQQLMVLLNKVKSLIDCYKEKFKDNRTYYDIILNCVDEDYMPSFIAEQIVDNYEVLDDEGNSFCFFREELVGGDISHLFYGFFSKDTIYSMIFKVLSDMMSECTSSSEVLQLIEYNKDIFYF